MGEWRNPDTILLLADVLGSPAFDLTPAAQRSLAVALGNTGFLVTTAYYVPDIDELYDVYRHHQMAEANHNGARPWMRWVMCGETLMALERKYCQASSPEPGPDRLFDMPIRRDPAARQPMFELLPQKDQKGAH